MVEQVLGAWVVLAAAAGPAGFASEELANGLRVTVVAEPANPNVATQLWYHVGSANEQPSRRGLAHLFEHLMFGATESRGPRDYEEYHHRHGGYENAYTTPDETVYLSEIAPAHHHGVLEMEADRMVRLVLTEDDLENEKRIVTEELRLRTENDPWSRLLVAAQSALLGNHPYAHAPAGTKEDLAVADVEACRSFYREHYRPDRAHLVIVGPVDPASTMAAVRERFGGIPGGGVDPPEIPALLDRSFPEEVVLEEDLPPAEIAVVAFPLPPADSEDRFAIDVLAQLLGGGATDPFREALVTRRGKALEAGTEWLLLRRGGGLFFYSASLPYRRKKTAFRLMDDTLREIGRLEWLTEESLAGAKRALLRRELTRVYFARSRAGAVGRAAWWQGNVEEAFDRPSRIDAVEIDDVRRVWRRYVAGASPSRIWIRPERVPLMIRLFGWVVPLVSR